MRLNSGNSKNQVRYALVCMGSQRFVWVFTDFYELKNQLKK